MAITTLAEYKVYAQISGTSDDTALQAMLDSANELAVRYTNRTSFDAGTYTELHSAGPAQTSFTVRVPPITSVTSVTLLAGTGQSSVLDSSLYTIDASSGIIHLWNTDGAIDYWGMTGFIPWWTGPGSRLIESELQWQLIYVGGGTAPAGMKYAVWRMVDLMWAAKRRDPTLRSESIGSYSYTIAGPASGGSSGGLSSAPKVFGSEEIASLLQPYVREGT